MKNAQLTEKLLISPAEACEILGIGRTTENGGEENE